MADFAYDDTGYGSMTHAGSAWRSGSGRPQAGAPRAVPGPDAAPANGYAAPAQGYAAPAQSYAAPAQGYAAPAQGYAAPAQGYGYPQQGYAYPAQGYQPQPYQAPGYHPHGYDGPGHAQPGYGDGYGGGELSGPAEEAGAPAPGRLQRLANSAGALLSLALVVGLAVWGYRLALRDVTAVPVVRALEGPMRMAPADPGGVLAEHQGLAVNSVAAAGTVAPVADELMLAPRPVELDGTDMPVPVVADAAPPVSTDGAGQAVVGSGVSDTLPAQPDVGTGAEALPAAAATDAAIAQDLMADAVEQAVAMAVAQQAPGVKSSPRPVPRPGGRATPIAQAAQPAMAAEIAPEAISPDMQLVQLGTFDTADAARADWARLSAIYPDAFRGKARVVQQASSGGQTFFRLRVQGFADEAAATEFCAVLLFGNTENCIPVPVN